MELQDEHQAACDLARSKDQLLELGQAEIFHLRESLSRAAAEQEEHGARWEVDPLLLRPTQLLIADRLMSTRLAEEKEVLLKTCEETVSLRLEEVGQLRLQLEAAQQEVAFSKNQVGFFKRPFDSKTTSRLVKPDSASSGHLREPVPEASGATGGGASETGHKALGQRRRAEKGERGSGRRAQTV